MELAKRYDEIRIEIIPGKSFALLTKEFQQALLKKILEEENGVKTATAKRLGIQRTNIDYWCRILLVKAPPGKRGGRR